MLFPIFVSSAFRAMFGWVFLPYLPIHWFAFKICQVWIFSLIPSIVLLLLLCLWLWWLFHSLLFSLQIFFSVYLFHSYYLLHDFLLLFKKYYASINLFECFEHTYFNICLGSIDWHRHYREQHFKLSIQNCWDPAEKFSHGLIRLHVQGWSSQHCLC